MNCCSRSGYNRRLKVWMFSFHGLATKYLDNYLGWHCIVDKDSKNASGRAIVSFHLLSALTHSITGSIPMAA